MSRRNRKRQSKSKQRQTPVTPKPPVEPKLAPEAVTENLCNDKKTLVADAKLVARAIKNGWDIPDAVRRRLPICFAKMALSKGHELRTRIAAAKVLLEMNKQNQAHLATNAPPPPGPTINVGVNVDASSVDETRSRVRAIAERFGSSCLPFEPAAGATVLGDAATGERKLESIVVEPVKPVGRKV